jgi:7-carboxy-7-deazaguanine synthase (Cx14CxxC type)
MYSVKEIYYTLQGEGANAGRPAVFCRFSGCNLWTGREQDRATATCQFCDTNFFGTDGPGGGKFATASELAGRVAASWPSASVDRARRLVVCTGGEPLLQVNEELIGEFHDRGFEVAVETNGTQVPPAGLDWVCVSPKAGTELVVKSGNELKLVYPQTNAKPEQFEKLNFDWLFLQPMDGLERDRNTRLALSYCLEHPQWRLSLQTHKMLQIP